MARLIKVAYGGVTVGIGGNSSITLTGRYRFSSSYTEAEISFECLVRSATRSTFLAAEAALLAAYRTDDGDLDVELGGTDRHSYSHSLNTGFNARARAEKLGTEQDTANAARYRCTVRVQLPADMSGRDGRQSSSVSVDATPAGKLTVVIEGAYTALSSTASAKASYEAAADTYCNTVIATFTGKTFNLLTPAGYSYDDQNKVLRFRRIYEQVFYRESQASTDVAGIKGQKLSIEYVTPTRTGDPGANARPFDTIRATYSCWVDSTVTTDLRSLYASTIAGHIFTEMGNVAQAGITLTREVPTYNPGENTISVVVEAVVAKSGLLFAKLEVDDQISLGKQLEPVWDSDPYAVDVYDVPILWIRTYRRTTVSAGGGDLTIPRPDGFIELARARGVYRDQIGALGALPIILGLDTFVFRKATQKGGDGSSQFEEIPPAITDTGRTTP